MENKEIWGEFFLFQFVFTCQKKPKMKIKLLVYSSTYCGFVKQLCFAPIHEIVQAGNYFKGKTGGIDAKMNFIQQQSFTQGF